jgi:hypothetical protein
MTVVAPRAAWHQVLEFTAAAVPQRDQVIRGDLAFLPEWLAAPVAREVLRPGDLDQPPAVLVILAVIAALVAGTAAGILGCFAAVAYPGGPGDPAFQAGPGKHQYACPGRLYRPAEFPVMTLNVSHVRLLASFIWLGLKGPMR